MRVTLYQAIIEALETLGGARHYSEVNEWIFAKYGPQWKSCETEIADMVHPERGGRNNKTSCHPIEKRILTRVDAGIYSL